MLIIKQIMKIWLFLSCYYFVWIWSPSTLTVWNYVTLRHLMDIVSVISSLWMSALFSFCILMHGIDNGTGRHIVVDFSVTLMTCTSTLIFTIIIVMKWHTWFKTKANMQCLKLCTKAKGLRVFGIPHSNVIEEDLT